MTTSILTNAPSLLAQRNVNTFGQFTADLGRQVSSGQRVSTPVDDASNFAIAQGLRTDVRAIDSLIQGLGNAKGVAEVGLAAATTTSDLLNEIRAKIVQGVNEGLTAQQRTVVDNDYQNMLNRMRQILENAVFNDTNIVIETAIPFNTIVGQVNDQDVLSSVDGDRLTLRGQRLDLAFALLDQEDLASTANAQNALTAFDNAASIVAVALGELGDDMREITYQIQQLEGLRDEVETGLGNIVDADLARVSAQQQSATVRDQLAQQGLNIANQFPNVISGLFPGG